MPRLVECIGDGYVFPLGMSYISASMKAEGFKVYTVNLSHKHEDPYDVLKELRPAILKKFEQYNEKLGFKYE